MTVFYSIGVDNEFETHGSLEDAKSFSIDTLDLVREESIDNLEWPEYVDNIEYGILTPIGRAVEKTIDEDNSDYELLPVASEGRDETRDVALWKSARINDEYGDLYTVHCTRVA